MIAHSTQPATWSERLLAFTVMMRTRARWLGKYIVAAAPVLKVVIWGS